MKNFIAKKIAGVITAAVLVVIGIGTYNSVHAQYEEVKEATNNGVFIPCFDAKASYQEAADTSAITTGVQQSIDTSTRSAFVSKLLILNSMLYGTDSFCGADTTSLSDGTRKGFIAQVDQQIFTLLNTTPNVGVFDHLAQEWLPGYENTQVNAQSGYDFLKTNIGLDRIWEYSRNIAYLGYVIIMLIIGFSIMMRKRLDGQTYVTVMNSIPRVIVGLILVTFSFAIAGLILDFGRIAINITGDVFMSITGDTPLTIQSVGEMFIQALDASAPSWKIEVPVAATAYAVSRAAVEFNPAGGTAEGTLWMLVVNGIKFVAQPIVIASAIVLLKYAILGVIILFAAVRIFFTIVTTYIKIFLDVILAPFQIMAGSVPGGSHIIGNWFRSLIANVLVFVLIFGIINFAWMIALDGTLENNMNFFTTGISASVLPDWIVTIEGIILIVGYFFAAGAPSIAENVLNVTKSRGISEAMGTAKRSFSKIPIVGNLMSK